MKYVYKWWAEWNDFGESCTDHKYFSSLLKVRDFDAIHRAQNNTTDYFSEYKKIEVA